MLVSSGKLTQDLPPIRKLAIMKRSAVGWVKFSPHARSESLKVNEHNHIVISPNIKDNDITYNETSTIGRHKRGTLCLLEFKSEDLFDYDIIHELVHTKTYDHSKRFMAKPNKYVGDGKAYSHVAGENEILGVIISVIIIRKAVLIDVRIFQIIGKIFRHPTMFTYTSTDRTDRGINKPMVYTLFLCSVLLNSVQIEFSHPNDSLSN